MRVTNCTASCSFCASLLNAPSIHGASGLWLCSRAKGGDVIAVPRTINKDAQDRQDVEAEGRRPSVGRVARSGDHATAREDCSPSEEEMMSSRNISCYGRVGDVLSLL